METKQFIVSDPFTITFIHYKARQLCRRREFSRSDIDDLSQGMRMYLLEKAHLFDPARGELAAFVTQALKTWMGMEIRYRARSKRSQTFHALSLEGTAVEGNDNVTCLAAVLPDSAAHRMTRVDPLSPSEHFELRDAIEHVMTKLTPEERALIHSVIENGTTATAKAMGVSWRQVANAIARIRPHFEKAGLAPERRGAMATTA